MNNVLFLAGMFWACCGCVLAAADDPDPRKVLEEARNATRKGQYEEALQKHLWYHENALKYSPSSSGVRLSFALSYWIELGEKYPKAREALVSIRDKNTKAIGEGGGSFELFHDVASINEYLKEDSKTVDLFKTLHEKKSDLCRLCYIVAEKNLTDQREYKICSPYIPDPLERFDAIREMRERNLNFAEKDFPHMKEIGENTFLEATCRVIAILAATGRTQDAEKVREKALAVRDDRPLRDGIEKALKAEQKPKE